jgi:hypothetical protein
VSIQLPHWMTTDAFRALRRGSDSVHGVYVLEHRHPDATRWNPIHRYATREIAEEHLERLVEAGAPRDEVRVEKRRIEDDDPTRG